MKTAIEVGEAILSVATTPMTKDETQMLVGAVMGEESGGEFPEERASAILQYKILKDRLAFGKVEASPWAIMFIASLCDKPGTIILYAAALGRRCSQIGVSAETPSKHGSHYRSAGSTVMHIADRRDKMDEATETVLRGSIEMEVR